METSGKRAALVAVDLGAQSCRVSLLRWKQGQPQIHVVHRFSNAPIATQAGLRWDVSRIFHGVTDGLRLCAGAAPEELRRLAWTGGLSTMFVWMGTGTQWLILSATEMSEHKTRKKKSTKLSLHRSSMH